LRSTTAREAGFTEKQLRPAIELHQRAPELSAQVRTGEKSLRDAREEAGLTKGSAAVKKEDKQPNSRTEIPTVEPEMSTQPKPRRGNRAAYEAIVVAEGGRQAAAGGSSLLEEHLERARQGLRAEWEEWLDQKWKKKVWGGSPTFHRTTAERGLGILKRAKERGLELDPPRDLMLYAQNNTYLRRMFSEVLPKKEPREKNEKPSLSVTKEAKWFRENVVTKGLEDPSCLGTEEEKIVLKDELKLLSRLLSDLLHRI